MSDATTFLKVLQWHPRIAIVGGPKTGKTTLVKDVSDRHVLHTDDLMELGWSEQPHEVMKRLGDLDHFVVEGIQAARALRKGLEVDAVVVLDETYGVVTNRQAGLGKAVHKWFSDWSEAIGDDKPPVYYL